MKLKFILKLGIALPVAFSALVSAVFAQDSLRDPTFLRARDAFRAGDRPKLERAAGELGNHELAPYVESWQLRMDIEQLDPAFIQDFLRRYDRSYVAEKLRADWLRLMAKRERWPDVEREYARLIAPEQDVSCYNQLARLKRDDKSVLDEILPLWRTLLEPSEPCVLALEALIWEKRVLADDVWIRVRRQVETNKLSWARQTLFYLPNSQSPDPRQLEQMLDRPPVYLARLPANWFTTRPGRELVLLAISRVARSEPAMAAEHLEKLQARLGAAERQWAWGQVAWQAAQRHLPQAMEWYALTGDTQLSDEVMEWKVRAALRARDWAMVHRTIERMPPALAALPEWTYWLGRAHKAGGQLEVANQLFARIAGQTHFYGNLADEELGRSVPVQPRPRPLTPEELNGAIQNPGLRRALAFFRLEARTEGVKEWAWTLRGMSDRELLAAAELARRQGIYDRAINTADKTQSEHDFSLRFLAPYSEQVRPAARNQALDDAWVYGLMRQESRFVTSAKSSVGASGLMQLMPKTAEWVAKKIGLKNFQPGRVNDTETNVLLGTSYMRMVMDNLDNHPVLASAAYNAGPGRARKWRAEVPLEGAIYAETIPFSETRDYVKKVMSNAVYYSTQFNNRPDSLKARLGVVGARNGGEPPKIEDLP
ncbi:MAG: hypothetical protein RIR00_1665 [Pseudomonadota bacterium]|jgi:soluble lytic murein transglycosylase